MGLLQPADQLLELQDPQVSDHHLHLDDVVDVPLAILEPLLAGVVDPHPVNDVFVLEGSWWDGEGQEPGIVTNKVQISGCPLVPAPSNLNPPLSSTTNKVH